MKTNVLILVDGFAEFLQAFFFYNGQRIHDVLEVGVYLWTLLSETFSVSARYSVFICDTIDKKVSKLLGHLT